MWTRSRFGSGSILGRMSLAATIGLAVVSGCAEEAAKVGESRELSSGDLAASGIMTRRVQAEAPQSAPARAQADGTPADPPKATANRKIIYTTTVELVTENLNQLEAGLTSLIESRGAYVADSSRTGAAGSTRHGTWKVRVPVDAYDAFVRGVLGLGELVSTQAQSQDVSAEYYDLDARTKAKLVEEARLLKHLADSTGRLDEILAVERELSRVRIEIEQMQGRLAVLSNLTSLATVTLTATEIHDYIPPQNPNLGQKVARTFAGSVETLQTLGETVLLFTVALAPWLPLLVPSAFVLLFLFRRWSPTFTPTRPLPTPPGP